MGGGSVSGRFSKRTIAQGTNGTRFAILEGCSYVALEEARTVNGDAMTKEHYTTGEIAKICGISSQTVVNYCNKGRIKAEQSPITGYRRISKAALVEFIRKNGLPPEVLDDFETDQGRRASSKQG